MRSLARWNIRFYLFHWAQCVWLFSLAQIDHIYNLVYVHVVQLVSNGARKKAAANTVAYSVLKNNNTKKKIKTNDRKTQIGELLCGCDLLLLFVFFHCSVSYTWFRSHYMPLHPMDIFNCVSIFFSLLLLNSLFFRFGC